MSETANYLIGVYSEQAIAQGYGTNFYSTPDGGEVEVHLVYPPDQVSDYNWPDKEIRGPVFQWLRSGKVDLNKTRWRRK